MRLPSQLDIGPYTIHLDVLTARVLRQRRRIRRWSIVALTLTVSTLMLGALAWGLVPWLHEPAPLHWSRIPPMPP